MNRWLIPVAAPVAVLLLTLPAFLAVPAPGAQARPDRGDKAVQDLLEPIRTKHQVPALAAAVVRSKGLVAVATVGVRKQGTDIAVTIHDLFHLGSDTKAMLAALIARLIELGLLRWDDPLERIFPDLANTMSADLRKVTVVQLLSHRSGLPANLKSGWGLVPRKGSTRDQRLVALKSAIASGLEGKPGQKFLYSNLGYTIAAAVAEKVADAGWEDLMKKYIFQPLKMTSVGYGAMGTPDQVDQPWQHGKNGKPIKPGPFSDNPPVMGPAGRVHCSLPDWAKFVADQLKGERGKKALLKPESYKKLHTPTFAGSDYTAGGWGANLNNKAVGGGLTLGHDGSNGMNYATALLIPGQDLAVLVVCNQGGDAGRDACHEAKVALLKHYLKTQ